MSKLHVLILILCCNSGIFAQIPAGQWRSHLSYRNVGELYANGQAVFALSEQGVFRYDAVTGELSKFTTVEGLRTARVTALGEFGGRVAFGYTDGSLDLMGEGGITAISAIRHSSFTTKSIREIRTFGNIGYACTGFGVVEFNTADAEVTGTFWQLTENGESIAVNDVFRDDGIIYLAAEGLLLRGSTSQNLQDFNNWYRYPDLQSYVSLNFFQGNLYVFTETNGVFRVSGDDLIPLALQDTTIYNANLAAEGLLVAHSAGISLFDGATSEWLPGTEGLTIRDVVSAGGKTFAGTVESGLLENPGISGVSIYPEGPYYSGNWSLHSNQGRLDVTSGSLVATLLPAGRSGGISTFNEGVWEVYNQEALSTVFNFGDVTDMVYDSNGEIIVSASHGQGIIRFGDSPQLLDNAQGIDFTSILEMEGDPWSGGYWILLKEGTNRLIFTEDFNDFTPYFVGVPSGLTDVQLVTGVDHVFILTRSTFQGRITVLEKQTGLTRQLDQTASNGNLPGDPMCISYDHTEDLWVGTDNGIAILPFIEMSGPVTSFTPFLEGAPLLRNTRILEIEVDPGNRKWVGSDEGAWLFSSRGDEQLQFFNTSNSPLPGNRVRDISVIPDFGEVFFLTENGIVSYGGSATRPGPDFSGVKIYPNPVYPGFSGYLVIDGLTVNSEVKITDVAGNLVWQGRSEGGRATWDLVMASGRLATSGVYFVMAAEENGSFGFSGKFVLIR